MIVLINNEFCRDKGEMTAALMNQSQIKDEKEFLEILKVVFEFLEGYEYFRDEKRILVILDKPNKKIEYKVEMLNKKSANQDLDILIEVKYGI